ncbi:MAG: outer membrane protein assembly factor BamD [Myxococcota bacterium]
MTVKAPHITSDWKKAALFCLLFLLPLSSLACKSAQRRPDESEYSFAARTKFEEAQNSLEGGYYTEAVKQFNEVKTQFPFSKYAILAELKIADAYFEQDDFIQAIDSYRQFIKLHPNHEEVPYAMYRVGLAFHEQAPRDWFLFPPASENDQTSTRSSVIAFKEYLARFPNDKNAKDAEEKIKAALKMLAESELNIAEFYAKRDHHKAAIGRLETLRREYPEFQDYGDAMLLLAELYIKTGETAEAKKLLSELISSQTDKSVVSKAEKMKNKLSQKGG